MEHRYSLRFESGERRGETIPITGTGITVGRKPGQSLQILDNSVSGKHAELVVDEQGVLLRDVGSTNGTRVGDQRVLETRLAHGDAVHFGNIHLTFQDARAGGALATANAGPKASLANAPTVVSNAHAAPARVAEGVDRVSADVIARSKKVSRPGVSVLILLVLGGGVWWYLNKSGKSGTQAVRPVHDVDGDLLADEFSFESDHDSWSSAEGSPAVFLKSGPASFSGAFGLACDLAPGEWALHRSQDVRAELERELVARAALRTRGAAQAMLGIEFVQHASGAAPLPGSFIAWSKPVSSSNGFEQVEIDAPVPPGYDGARVVLGASALTASGSVAADDVSLVARASDAKPAATLAEYRFYTHGDPPASAHLFKVDRVLVSDLAFASDAAGKIPRELVHGAPLSARAGANGITLGVPPAKSLTLRAEAPLAHARIATIGEQGHQSHGSDFERANVTTLLLGSGRDLLRFQFGSPAVVRGTSDGAAARIAIEFANPVSEVELQLDFKEERAQAGNLAHAARNAEKKGDLGDCLRQWTELLNGHPYEEALVTEAEATRGRLIQHGFEELRGVRQEIERARFFRLVDLFRRCREKALAIGARYSPSEVETEARAVAAEVDGDLAGLEADLSQAERARLTAILSTLEAQKADGLAGEVKDYIETHLKGR